jgi:phosphohistidine phosphatase
MNGPHPMKRLILMRHAKSSWDHPDLADFDRPLNKRGKRDAPLMGKRLREMREKPDLILSSPAARAVSTVEKIAEKIGFPKKKIVLNKGIYQAGMDELLRILKSIDNFHADVLVCGHNPGLTDLCNFLSDSPIDNIPTCGLVCQEFAIDSWIYLERGSGTLVYFDYPKRHYP